MTKEIEGRSIFRGFPVTPADGVPHAHCLACGKVAVGYRIATAEDARWDTRYVEGGKMFLCEDHIG